MHYNGVIFDFNGTLLFDDAYHVVAWDRIAMEVAGKHLTAEQMDTEYAGFPNIEILRRLSGGTLTPDQLEYYSLRKEELYRETVRNVPGGAKLVPGANELFDYLKEHEIPCAIATASIIQNIEFFVETFHLDKWFDMDHIVYDNNTYKNKIMMFRDACDRIGTHENMNRTTRSSLRSLILWRISAGQTDTFKQIKPSSRTAASSTSPSDFGNIPPSRV